MKHQLLFISLSNLKNIILILILLKFIDSRYISTCDGHTKHETENHTHSILLFSHQGYRVLDNGRPDLVQGLVGKSQNPICSS